jgi:CYTH domain-containing protein/shikimate kinase
MTRTEKKSGPEIEERFIVLGIDPDIFRSPSIHIKQGYFQTHPDTSVRVRVYDRQHMPAGRMWAEITKKTGHGEVRKEENEPLPLTAARLLLDPFITDIIQKQRYQRDGWDIDVYEGPLKGLVKAEFEKKQAGSKVTLPPWIHQAIEVTNSITDRLLARMARDLVNSSLDQPIRDILPKRSRRIVLTGGPCSGKSTIMQILQESMGSKLHCVPEVATIVIVQVGAKPPQDKLGMCEFQRTLYHVQRGFESVAELQAVQDGKLGLLLDRGTRDSEPYVPGGSTELDQICHTSQTHEFSQYDLVIHLDTPPKNIYEANKKNNPARSESHEQAARLNLLTVEAWLQHPNYHRIESTGKWEDKVAQVQKIITTFLQN